MRVLGLSNCLSDVLARIFRIALIECDQRDDTTQKGHPAGYFRLLGQGDHRHPWPVRGDALRRGTTSSGAENGSHLEIFGGLPEA